MMRNTKIFAIVAGALISTSVFAARVPYTMLQPGQETSCTSSSSSACPFFMAGPIVIVGTFYYDTTTHQLVANSQFRNLRLQFINDKFTLSQCQSNPAFGNPQQEPLSYCQNSQNYYVLSTMTLVYHPHSQLITQTATATSTFDASGSIGWVKATMSGGIFSPGNAL